MRSLPFYKLNAMKKILLITLALVTSVMSATVKAGNKKDKKQRL